MAIDPLAPAISIRERYGDVASDRWPVIVEPQQDEMLLSWLHRLAYANGVAPRAFARVLGLTPGMWSASLDLRLPGDIARQLCANTGVSPDQLAAMTLSHALPKQLLLPLRNSGRRDRSTWLQFCSQCLTEDSQPYFRRRWRLATRVSCTKHGCRLRDRCPCCRSRIAVFNGRRLVPQHRCAYCGCDLRRASIITIGPGAKWFDRCIDDICRPEELTSSPTGRALMRRLLNMPGLVCLYSASILTSLSTAARTRCVEKLTYHLSDWLMDDEDISFSERGYSYLPSSNSSRIVELLTAALTRKIGRPIAANHRQPAATDTELLKAYVQTSPGLSIHHHMRFNGSGSFRDVVKQEAILR
ncbi:TniQ family protein [Rhizobium sp. ZPR3]|uniref:TniQ family protein n=2 Tax=unclassified Rhizobium TaxID=2613769 RepID=A0AAU7SPF9_9HYPH